MSTTTTNLGLVKPEMTDAADITAMNGNWDKIDSFSTATQTALNNKQDALFLSHGFTTIDEITDVLQNCKETETITDIDSFYPINDGVKIGVYITDAETQYIIALRNQEETRQIAFSCNSHQTLQRFKTDYNTNWGAWINSAFLRIGIQNTYALSSYNASVDYDFSAYTTHANVKIISCTNDGNATCVGTMCDIANNKIWFFKPQGISSAVNLNITYQVIEF